MSVNYNKTPFPWFGGKAKAAPKVWELLGDPAHYVEPFAGGLGVLLNRPHQANRTYFSETVCDIDGLLVNAWRSIQLHPDATAEAASNPVFEADMHARHVALIRWREERQLEHLMGDPEWCDPKMGGWWLWGVCCWIGSGWCETEVGPWWPDSDDRLTKWVRGDPNRETFDTREPGVSRQLPHLTNNGMGVNHAGTREPGVWRQLPHLSDDGMGVNRPQLREPGVSRQLPHLTNDGMGVNHAGTREPGVEYHPVTMPELRKWMQYLSARLRHVRIVNTDWKRVTTGGAVKSLPVRSGNGHAGIFLDPPYGETADRAKVYGEHESFTVADEVTEWCLKWGNEPGYRIVVAGYEGENHERLLEEGWTAHEWYSQGHLTGGYGAGSDGGHQQGRERLWASPGCVVERQVTLFD